MIKILLLTLSFILFQSCNYSSPKTQPAEPSTPPSNSAGTGNNSETGSGANNPAEKPDDVFISFATITKDVVSTCVKCHKVDRPGKPQLTTIANYIKEMATVLDEVNANEMPPAGMAPLTACQKALLQKWYDLGAPETSNVNVKSLPECLI
jgi:uncharacterized membrane protein